MRCLMTILFALLLFFAGELLAQDSRAKQVRASGSVTVELFVGRQGVGVVAQRWSQAFERAGVAVTIRGKMYGDKPDVSETKSDATRHVTVVGEQGLWVGHPSEGRPGSQAAPTSFHGRHWGDGARRSQ